MERKAWLRGVWEMVKEAFCQKIMTWNLPSSPLLLPNQFSGLSVIVTGATSGIGLHTARELAMAGAHVTMACRNTKSACEIARMWQQEAQDSRELLVEVMGLDLLSLSSVRCFAQEWNRRGRPLHVLINNAGVLLMGVYIMAPGSKRSSANSNSTAMQLDIPTPQPHTIHNMATTTSSVPSTATHASVSGPPPSNLRRVRGPTLGKRVRRMISANSGSKLKVYVTQEMQTFCGENATKVSNELGAHIRRMFPVDGFVHSWKRVDPGLKAAIIQAVRDKFSVTEDDDEFTPLVEQVFHKKGNILYKDWKWRMTHHYNELKEKREDPYQHPFEGVTMDGWKFMIDHIFNDPKWQARKRAGKKNRHKVVEGFTVASRGHTLGSRSIAAAITIEADKHDGRVPDFPEIYQAAKTKKDGGWIDPQCEELHEKMVAMRDEATQSGTPLTAEELSTSVLGAAKYYVRGLGVGRRPSSLSPSSNSAHQEVLKLQAEMELMREERRIEREDQRRREEEQREDQRRRDEEHQSRCDALQRQLEEFENFKALMMKQMLGQDVGKSS